MRLPPLLLVPLFTLGCGGDTPPPEGAYLHAGTFMSGQCSTINTTLAVSRSDTSSGPPAWAEVTAIPHARPTEPAWRVTTPCLDGTTGFEVTERGHVLSYQGSIAQRGQTYTIRSVANDAGTSGFVSDQSGNLEGSVIVDVSDGSRTERTTLQFEARR